MWPYVMGELAETNANLQSTPSKIREDHKGHVIVAQANILLQNFHSGPYILPIICMSVRMVHAQTSSELY